MVATRVAAVLDRVLLVCLLVWIGWQVMPQARAVAGLESADRAPDVTFASLEGDTLRLVDLRGSVVVLSFWASWCRKCGDEMPGLADLERELGGEAVKVLAVSVDRGGDGAVRAFLERHESPSWVGRETPGLRTAFGGIPGVPTTFVIDREGVVRHRLFGPFSGRALEVAVRRLLGT